MRKTRSDKGGHHNYPKRNKNVAADIKISNKQQLLNMIDRNIAHWEREFVSQQKQIDEETDTNIKELMIKQHLEELNDKGKTYPTLLQLKEGVEKRRMVTAKSLLIYAQMLPDADKHLSREERGGQLVLNMLAKEGIDVSNTTAIRKAMGGYTPSQIYHAWDDLHQNDPDKDWYEVMHEDVEGTINEAVQHLNQIKENNLLEELEKYGIK